MASGWITKKRRRAVIEDRDASMCWRCYNSVVYGANLLDGFSPAQVSTLDHVICRCYNGGNGNDNVITFCMCCNSSRKNTPLEDFVDSDTYFAIQLQLMSYCSVEMRVKKVAA